MKRNHLMAVAGVCIMLALGSCNKESVEPNLTQLDDAAMDDPIHFPKFPNIDYVSNEVLIKFKSSASEALRNEVLAKISGKMEEVVFTKAMETAGETEGIARVYTPMAVTQALEMVRSSSAIAYAEPNHIWHLDATSNDPYFTNSSLWGMYGDSSSPSNQFGSQAADAWNNGNTGSSEVVVGIIDEGVMRTHPDLVNNIWVNPYETANGIDDDGNGYKDDIYGWDFVGNDNTTYDGTSDDHGTHVAGTIGAEGGNNTGVVGVCWSVKMITAKFLGKSGGTTLNAIRAIDYLTDLKRRHAINLVATNNSWGGGGYSQGLYDAIERSKNADILFIAAAGNNGSNNDATAHYPSSYSNANIIAVASITSTGGLSSFSNYGANSVDIGAPGSSINSTLPGRKGATYGSYSGTSMATPHVTGAAALYKATHSTANYSTIRSAIINSAISTTSLSGRCTSGARLNCSNF